jgi:surface protein
MFYGCSSLSSLPDISNWDTENVRNMDNIFDYYNNIDESENNNASTIG